MFVALLLSLSLSSVAPAAPLAAYRAAQEIVSADATGPSGMANTLSLKDGKVVNWYKAFNQGGCTLGFKSSKTASLKKGEVLRQPREFTVKSTLRENCLEWQEKGNGGDDMCLKYGPDFIDQILSGELTRESNGERVTVFCVAHEEKEASGAYALWARSLGTLFISLE
ncbi:MAG TPA: hypothetical protein VIH99_11435 [Bdellovibrionota bacterium]|jgi:hypothetical protein